MKKTYKYDREGRRELVSEEVSEKELDMQLKHKLKYMPLWIILVLGAFIFMLALAVNLTADANEVQISCKIEGIHEVAPYYVFDAGLNYMPYNLDCTFIGPMPK